MEPLSDSSNTPDSVARRRSRKSAQKASRNSTPRSAGESLLRAAQRRSSLSRPQPRRLTLQSSQTAIENALLEPDQVAALYHRCIKLATENKISGKNTWELGLIDYMHDLVQPNAQEGSTTNFQRASVTLGAGVEIYSKRVDSVHNEAFKVLGSLARGAAAGADGEAQQGDAEDDGPENDAERQKVSRRAAMLRDVNPSSTLEPNFEALNVKKFDLAFTVDPLFHKTSAQFDEGGAGGLLLHNLGVSGGCEILFDSQEMPEAQHTAPAAEQVRQVSVAPMRRQILEAMTGCKDARICPAMDELSGMLGRAAEADFQQMAEDLVASVPEVEVPLASRASNGSGGVGGLGPSHLSEDDEAEGIVFDEGFHEGLDTSSASDREDGAPRDLEGGEEPVWMTQQPLDSQMESTEISGIDAESFPNDEDAGSAGQADSFQAIQERNAADAVQWLVSGVENLSLEGKGWAGAGHWHYRTRLQRADGAEAAAGGQTGPKAKRKKGEPIDFNNLPELDQEVLALANPKDIKRKTCSSRAATLLPEDHHYKASSLAELFLRPGIPIFGVATASRRDTDGEAVGLGATEEAQLVGQMDDEDYAIEHETYDDSSAWTGVDFGDTSGLVDAPRKVAQIGINYARAAKQVDVRALKQLLWRSIGDCHDRREEAVEVSFQDALEALSPTDAVLGDASGLSIHLCFICLLHLANENGLSIRGSDTLDTLAISGLPEVSTL